MLWGQRRPLVGACSEEPATVARRRQPTDRSIAARTAIPQNDRTRPRRIGARTTTSSLDPRLSPKGPRSIHATLLATRSPLVPAAIRASFPRRGPPPRSPPEPPASKPSIHRERTACPEGPALRRDRPIGWPFRAAASPPRRARRLTATAGRARSSRPLLALPNLAARSRPERRGSVYRPFVHPRRDRRASCAPNHPDRLSLSLSRPIAPKHDQASELDRGTAERLLDGHA